MQKPNNMSFLSSGIFWGSIVILIGISILIKEIFHVHIPIFKVLFGLILIYLGVKVIAKNFNVGSGNNAHQTFFSSSKVEYNSNNQDYNVIFGSSTIDFTNINSVIQDKHLEVNVVFGEAKLLINDNLPVIIKSTTAFGSTILETKNSSGFGETYYTSPSYVEGQPHIEISTNTVFGKLRIYKNPSSSF